MKHYKLFIELADTLDQIGLRASAGLVDSYLSKQADLQLKMEKEVEKEEDNDKDDKKKDKKDKETKSKSITLKFD